MVVDSNSKFDRWTHNGRNHLSCMHNISIRIGIFRMHIINNCSSLFGLAHFHHGFQMLRELGWTKSAIKLALYSSIFQMTYTTLFGWYKSILFKKSESIVIPILCHCICNYFSIPPVSEKCTFKLYRFWDFIFFLIILQI